MISVSNDFNTAITGTTREIRAYLDFNSGTIFRGADGLISIRFENSLMDEDRVSVGCACSSYVVCEWFNKLTGVSLANSYFDAYIGVVESYAQTKPVGSIEDDTAVVEYVKLGRFWITDIERGKATTKVTAYDAMSKASGDYSPTVTAGVNGYSVPSIISDICTQTGITWTSSGSAYVDKIYESTGRDQLGWLCSVLYGDGSSFVIDRTSGDLTAVNFVKSVADGTIDDTTIYLDGVEDKPTFTIGSVEMGTDEATYTAGSGVGISKFNPYATQTLVDSIYADVDGMSFTPMKLHFRGDPRIEVGDLLSVTTDSNTYSVTVMKQTLTFNGGLECTLECFGDLEAHYIMSKSPTEAQIQRTNTVVAEMAEALENADNGIITTIKDADGFPTELLILNSMDKDTATSVWRWNINGLGHTNAYNGGTYNFALDDQGRINASMLIIGTITDQQGYNSWNLDTGAFTITNGSINIITANKDVDSISLNYSTYSDDISPYSVKLTDTDPSINQRTVVNATGIKGYRGGNWATPANTSMLLSAGGMLELGGNGSNGTFTLKNSTGDTVAFWSGLTERLKLTDADGNGGILSLGGESLYFTNSSNNSLLNISPSTGTAIFDVGGIYRAEYSKEYVRFKNASTMITAQLNTSSNNSYLMLGDGSTTYNRTLLDNTGLTFRNASDVVTANYPSDGLYFMSWTTNNSMTSAEICSLLQTNNANIPTKKTVIVRISGPSGSYMTLIVQNASVNYGAAWPVGYYSQYRFELSAGTWYLKDAYEAPSVASYWSSGKENCPFIDTATPPNAASYWPTVGMKTPGGQWTIGRLGENLDLVYTATAQIGSTNNVIRYQLDGDASNASNLAYTILSSKNGALKPTHQFTGGTYSSATTSYKYTGYSVTIPSGKCFLLTIHAYYSTVEPASVCISTSSTSLATGAIQYEANVDSLGTRARGTFGGYADQQYTYYLWVKGRGSGSVGVSIDSFYFS